MLTVFLIASALAPYVASASEASPQRALLCTSMGYQWVDIADQNEGVKNTNQHCVYCLFSSADNIDGILSKVHNTFSEDAKQLIPHQHQTKLISSGKLFTAHPRAPPITL